MPSTSFDPSLCTAAKPPCVMVVNTNDPSGAGGLTADISTIVSVGGHPVAIACGAYVRDTHHIHDAYVLEADSVAEQARCVLEDMPVDALKIGFAGSTENLSVLASLVSDYPELPLIAYMPSLAWWDAELIDPYLEAYQELLLPEATLLVGNHSTLSRWLLPDWDHEAPPGPRDIAAAAAHAGTPYTLITGIAMPEQHLDNVLASPATVLYSRRLERFDATFTGAGETLSAAITALLANGYELVEAVSEALAYLDRCLESGFRPGMGHVLPDRMFWAEPDDGAEAGVEDDTAETLELKASENLQAPPT